MKERHQLPISWRLDSFTGPLPFRRLQDYLGNVSAFFTTDSIVAPRSKSSSYPGRFLDSTLAAVGYLLLREELPQNRPTAEALFPLSEFSYRSKKRRCTVLLLLWKQSGKKADSSSTYCCRFKLLTCVLAKRQLCLFTQNSCKPWRMKSLNLAALRRFNLQRRSSHSWVKCTWDYVSATTELPQGGEACLQTLVLSHTASPQTSRTRLHV